MAKKSKEETTEIKTDNFTAEVTTKAGCQTSMTVNIHADSLRSYFKKALKEISKQVSLPGFRKGKVPESLIRKRFENVLLEQVKKDAFRSISQELYKESSLQPVAPAQVQHEWTSFDEQNGAVLSLSYESEPKVDPVDLKSIKLKKVDKKEVTEEDLNDVLENFASYQASWDEITDRPSEEGDYIEIDIETDGQKIVESQRFHIKPKKMGKWLLKLVTGKKKGDSAEGMSEADDSLSSKAKKEFKSKPCKVIIKGVYKANLPEIDDELAKKFGAASLAEMKTKIRLQLQQEQENSVKEDLKEQIDDILGQLQSFELPENLLKTEIQSRIDRKTRQLKEEKVAEEEIEKQQKDIEKEAQANAEKVLRVFFILQSIAREHNITATEAEIRQAVFQQVQQMGLFQQDTSPNFREHLLHQIRMTCIVNIINDKVKELIIRSAEVS